MVEELKLAIKVDDDAIEQSLLKQFANAEKMANKVVLTFNNIDLDDKAIEAKFKEMQKMAGKNPIDLSIDKSSIEMLSAISKQLGNIFDIAKGKSIIDSSATVADVNKITQSTNQQVKAVEKVTSSYKNQAYELASILKMLAKFDKYDEVPYAAAMSKAIKSDAKSYKNGNTIQFAPKKYGMDEDSLKYLRGLSVNLSGAFNYTDTLGLDTANINNLEILIKYYRELLKEKLEFNNIKLNTSDTEELIKALGILKKEHFDDDTKSGRNVYGDAYLDKYSNLDMIKDYLKEQEKQAIATAQAEQKLADAEKEVVKSSIPESQNKIQEELKETQKQAEQTSESLSNIGDGNKSNISSENSIIESQNKIQEELKETQEQATKTNNEIITLYRGVSKGSGVKSDLGDSFFTTDLESAIAYAGGLEGEVYKLELPLSKIKDFLQFNANGGNFALLDNLGNGTDEVSKKLINLVEKLKELEKEGNVRIVKKDFFGNVFDTYTEEAQKIIDEIKIINRDTSSLLGASPLKDSSSDQQWGLRTDDLARKAKANGYNGVVFDNIQDSALIDGRIIKSISILNDELLKTAQLISQVDLEKVFNSSDILKTQFGSIEGLQENLLEVCQEVEKTEQAIKSVAETPIKYVFQGDKIDQATTSAKELDKTLEQVDIPTDSFDDVLSKLDLTKSKLKEIVKITKQSVSDSEGKFHDSYTLKDKRGSTEIYGLSSNTEKGQLLRSNIVGYDAKEIEQEAKAVQKLAEEKRKLRQQEKQSTQSSVDKALKDQVSAWKQIQSIREKIAKSNDANEIENLKKVKKEYQQSYIEADKILKINSDIYDKEAQIARLEQVRLETNKKIADYKNPDISSMESSLARFEESSEKLSLKPDNEHSFESWKLKIDELNNAINEYRNKITELQNKDGIIDKEDISEATELENRIKSLLREMQKTSSGDKGFEDISATKIAEQIHKLLEDNTAMSRKAKAEIQAYYDEVASGNPSRPLKEIYNDALKVVQAERAMGREGKSFLDTMKDKAWYGWAAQITSMFGVYDIINIFKQGANTLKEFDDGLTKISYTMDMTKSQLNDLGNSVLDMANDLDSSINNAMQVSQIYANMNTSAEEIKKLSEPTLILSNLTGFDASTVADDIQAVTQQFDIAAESSMHIADVYDQISRNISVDYSKGIESIAEAVQVAGSTADQAGLSFEQLAAIVGKTVEKTRLEGSQVGNGLKTIMTRLSKVGELSEEVDNETLSQASESLKKVGIEVYNLDGSYREFDVIMGELAGKWGDLTDAEKSNISFNIAATRQTNLLSAVLSNFSDSMQLAEEATNANGNALENNQKWVDSFGGHLQSLENTAKSAWINILDSETIKGGVDVLNSLLKVVVELIDTFGILPTAAGIGGIVAGFKNIGREKCYPSYRICL